MKLTPVGLTRWILFSVEIKMCIKGYLESMKQMWKMFAWNSWNKLIEFLLLHLELIRSLKKVRDLCEFFLILCLHSHFVCMKTTEIAFCYIYLSVVEIWPICLSIITSEHALEDLLQLIILWCALCWFNLLTKMSVSLPKELFILVSLQMSVYLYTHTQAPCVRFCKFVTM